MQIAGKYSRGARNKTPLSLTPITLLHKPRMGCKLISYRLLQEVFCASKGKITSRYLLLIAD
jgi:hypothetical protein